MWLAILKTHLKLEHSFLHALHIKYHSNEILYFRGQCGLGTRGNSNLLSRVLITTTTIVYLQGVELARPLDKALFTGAP